MEWWTAIPAAWSVVWLLIFLFVAHHAWRDQLPDLGLAIAEWALCCVIGWACTAGTSLLTVWVLAP